MKKFYRVERNFSECSIHPTPVICSCSNSFVLEFFILQFTLGYTYLTRCLSVGVFYKVFPEFTLEISRMSMLHEHLNYLKDQLKIVSQ